MQANRLMLWLAYDSKSKHQVKIKGMFALFLNCFLLAAASILLSEVLFNDEIFLIQIPLTNLCLENGPILVSVL